MRLLPALFRLCMSPTPKQMSVFASSFGRIRRIGPCPSTDEASWLCDEVCGGLDVLAVWFNAIEHLDVREICAKRMLKKFRYFQFAVTVSIGWFSRYQRADQANSENKSLKTAVLVAIHENRARVSKVTRFVPNLHQV